MNWITDCVMNVFCMTAYIKWMDGIRERDVTWFWHFYMKNGAIPILMIFFGHSPSWKPVMGAEMYHFKNEIIVNYDHSETAYRFR